MTPNDSPRHVSSHPGSGNGTAASGRTHRNATDIGHVPGMLPGVGLGTMSLSLFIAAAGLLTAWLEARMRQ